MLQSQRPELRQEQKLRMTPQLYQAIKIMALPLAELKTTIEEELERNPALEVVEDPTTTTLESPGDEDPFESAPYDNTDFTPVARTTDEDANRSFIEGAFSRGETLQEHLLWQLRLQPLEPTDFRIGELLIQNLDANGFHRGDPATLIAAEDRSRLPAVQELIQSFEPVGTCTTGYLQALLAQIRLHPDPPVGSVELVTHHLEAVERGKIDKVATALDTSVPRVEELLAFVRELEPYPGRQFGTDDTRYVVPDLTVRVVAGELEVVFNDEVIPILGVSTFFEKLAGTTGGDEAKRFAAQNLQQARWFIRSIRERNRSLLKVAVAIVEFQREFFHRGAKYLVPLTLRDIADEVGLHETSVSRITTGKYLQTETGVFELKYFFTNSISGAGSQGSRFSKTGVKAMLAEIITESTGKALSDNRLTTILAERGVKIARRTVAKYRRELDIASSFDR